MPSSNPRRSASRALVAELLSPRVLAGLGRASAICGSLLLLFVAYQLWGTGLREAQAQRDLAQKFEVLKAAARTGDRSGAAPADTGSTTSSSSGGPVAADLPLPAEGDPIGHLRIPAIGLDRMVVSGTSVLQLKRGPGHYPGTPMPGQKGNTVIAGHRTTYGQPFHNVDKLEPGDEILFETVQGDVVYRVTETKVVKPSQVEVLDDYGDNRVTLIACEPKFSAAKRIIITGELVTDTLPMLTGQVEAARRLETQSDGVSNLDGDAEMAASRSPAIIWGVAAAGVWLVTWTARILIRRRVWRRAEARGERPGRLRRMLPWSPYFVGIPTLAVALYGFFENVARLLPANF